MTIMSRGTLKYIWVKITKPTHYKYKYKDARTFEKHLNS